MLSREENQLLTQTAPGTPMGELFRRFWLPALIPNELPEPDCPPVRLRILHEDLVAFRDTNGKVGILDALCPHKLAPLFFGRNEECGLRCVYHGWKFDVDGNCVEMANEPPESAFRDKVKVKAYSVEEWGGLIWVYMGPAHLKPELPQFEWARVPETHRHLARWLQTTNWAQGMEGEIDTSHISFLHRWMDQSQAPQRRNAQRNFTIVDGAPILTLNQTDYGFVYGARRNTGNGDYYWRVTQWLYPMWSVIAAQTWPIGGRAWVPIDDENTNVFGYNYNAEAPLTEEQVTMIESGRAFPPRTTREKHMLADGTVIDHNVGVANKTNDFLIDRAMQRTVNFTGIWGVNEQDRGLQEGMGRIVDRSREHLGTADQATIAGRRALLRMARDLQEGIEPAIAHQGAKYGVRSMDIVSPEGDFTKFMELHGDAGKAKV
jgi:phenylpropionate dioxygenase-like ring-hydroxylating dioxygenase large terminal subunit